MRLLEGLLLYEVDSINVVVRVDEIGSDSVFPLVHSHPLVASALLVLLSTLLLHQFLHRHDVQLFSFISQTNHILLNLIGRASLLKVDRCVLRDLGLTI